MLEEDRLGQGILMAAGTPPNKNHRKVKEITLVEQILCMYTDM